LRKKKKKKDEISFAVVCNLVIKKPSIDKQRLSHELTFSVPDVDKTKINFFFQSKSKRHQSKDQSNDQKEM
jgi:hypothetical protein